MRKDKDKDFEERRKTSEAAKKALLEKFRSAPGADDPAVQERAAERRVIAENRRLREAEREKAKAAEIARKAQEEEDRLNAERAAEAQRLADEEAEKAARAEAQRGLAARVVADEAARKAARDAKYAARKARQK